MAMNWKMIAVSVVCYAKKTSFDLKFFLQIDENEFVPEELIDGFMIRFKGYNVGLHLRKAALYYKAYEPNGEVEEQLENSLAAVNLFKTAINELRVLKSQRGGEHV
ncbi:MAG: hypothetical protein WC663_00130 [Patescibacteria group bacterium]|jgi:hypothetical protein